MAQLAPSCLTLNDAVTSFSFLKILRIGSSGNVSCGCGWDVILFQKGKIIVLLQAKKSTKEIIETIKIGLRIVQRIIKT